MQFSTLLFFLVTVLTIVLSSGIIISYSRHLSKKNSIALSQHFTQLQNERDQFTELLRQHELTQQRQRERFDEHQINSLKLIQDSLQKAVSQAHEQVHQTLKQHTELLNQQLNGLTKTVATQLTEINQRVDKQLHVGFEKTNATFNDVMKRLTIIDQAQKKITELSSNVVDLQNILGDKKTRGAFGEVQLNGLIRNMLPENHFSLQHTLSNGKRVDCLLYLPEPSGNIAIDAKFPLESYRALSELASNTTEQKRIMQRFQQDLLVHIQAISEKYIIPGETADGAIMFIPAEAIFAEIHAHHPAVVDAAQRARVWLVSPTTLMAILTTARAVLKDAATRQQVHVIQEHLGKLGVDFERFQKRMDNLARHIGQAQQDVDQVHRSAEKISGRFRKIEQVELQNATETDNSLTLSDN